MRGLKGSAEGQDLKSFIEQLLVDLDDLNATTDDSNATTGLSVELAYRVRVLRKTRKTPCDVQIKFPDGETKVLTKHLLNQNSGIKVGGTIFISDLSEITLQKR